MVQMEVPGPGKVFETDGPFLAEGRKVGEVRDMGKPQDSKTDPAVFLRRQGIDMPAGEVSRDLEERDRRDSTRADSPLRQAEGALVLDTSRCSIDEQVDAILRAYFAAVRATRAPGGPAGSEASRPPEGERP